MIKDMVAETKNLETQVLEIKNLSFIRSGKYLFKNISLQLCAGEILLVEGANGSGKSTLLRLIAGLSTSPMGDIYWQGCPIYTARANYFGALHFVGHANGIKLGLTVQENVTLLQHLALANISAEKFLEVLNFLELQNNLSTIANNLSAGQKRRLSLAKLFLLQKKIWILDEPCTALDNQMQTKFLFALETYVKNGGIVIISSHHAMFAPDANIKKLNLPLC